MQNKLNANTPKGKSRGNREVIDDCFRNVYRKEVEKERANKAQNQTCETQFNEGDQMVKFSVDADDSFCQSESENSVQLKTLI